MRGAFIVLEGLDRSGKSTQASILCETLRAQGRKVSLWKYPARETFLGTTIDGYLKSSVSLPDETIHLLFSANRWETVEKLLAELNEGTDIVCDRYVYSGIAYSAAKGLDLEWCRAPDRGLPAPDLVLYMQVSSEVAKQRGGYGEERYEKEEFQRKVGDQFLRLGVSERNWKIVNADRPASVISEEITQLCGCIGEDSRMKAPSKLWIDKEPMSTGELASISELSKSDTGRKVSLRARVQRFRKQGNKLMFLLLRERYYTIQAVVSSPSVLEKLEKLSKESIVELQGTVVSAPTKINTATHSDIEISVEAIEIVSLAEQPLPIQLEDLDSSVGQGEMKIVPTVVLETRLSNRIIDLRTSCSQAIFEVQSEIGRLFREFFTKRNFIEIHTPKILSAASEGGASVFRVNYFDKTAFLAQSPQFYKQMAVMGDMPGVFEVGPVFRAENSQTHRHLTEFVGLDFELRIERDFKQLVDLVDEMFNYIFTGLTTHSKASSLVDHIKQQHPFDDLQWNHPCLKIEFRDAVMVLKKFGPNILQNDLAYIDHQLSVLEAHSDDLTSISTQCNLLRKRKAEISAHAESLCEKNFEISDFGTSDEKLLGRIIKQNKNTDFYIITKYPSAVRPFYTMPDPEDPSLTNSYDVFLRGEEIVSGAQRIHDSDQLIENAKNKDVDLSQAQDYLSAFRYGAFPHGGGGVGLERLVMLYCGLGNIRLTSLFPRDPNRLTP